MQRDRPGLHYAKKMGPSLFHMCHPYAGAMLIFSVFFQFRLLPLRRGQNNKKFWIYIPLQSESKFPLNSDLPLRSDWVDAWLRGWYVQKGTTFESQRGKPMSADLPVFPPRIAVDFSHLKCCILHLLKMLLVQQLKWFHFQIPRLQERRYQFRNSFESLNHDIQNSKRREFCRQWR